MKETGKASFLLRCTRLLLKWISSLFYMMGLLRKALQKSIFIQEFDYRKDDVYIVTYMKSGTTLLQMVVYQLLTDGDMDFGHIYDVSPWIEYAAVIGQSLHMLPSPRVLKSHLEYKDFPKVKGKIIYGIRNGMDVAVSMFHHYNDLELSGLKWEQFYDRVFMKKSWFRHVHAWKQNKRKLDVFYVRYEDLTKNMRKTVEDLAAFLGVKLTEETLQRVLERCSFGYMKLNQEKFGGHKPKQDRRKYDQFIRKGESGKGRSQFNEAQVEEYNMLYKKYLSRLELGYSA